MARRQFVKVSALFVLGVKYRSKKSRRKAGQRTYVLITHMVLIQVPRCPNRIRRSSQPVKDEIEGRVIHHSLWHSRKLAAPARDYEASEHQKEDSTKREGSISPNLYTTREER